VTEFSFPLASRLFNALVWPLLFVLVPRDWTLPKEPIIGAEAMHLQMRRWLADLGHEACREGA
jgi:hypothetical protein